MAKFNFLDLNKEVRTLMLGEINSDIQNKRLFISTRLNGVGVEMYQGYLISSVETGDEETFEKLLNLEKYFNITELRNDRVVNVPNNAAKLLCQSEFNRYYIRGLCIKAIKDGINEVEIYRGRESSSARPESEGLIGSSLNAKDLLEDLRSSIGIAPKLFPHINSGLTVRI